MSPTRSKSLTEARSLTPDEPGRYHAPRLRVASYVQTVAFRHGLSPAWLHAQLHGPRPISTLLREVVAEAVAEGKREQVAVYADQIEAAFRGLTLPPDDAVHIPDPLIRRVIAADIREDISRQHFLMNRRCPVARRRWRRDAQLERATKLEALLVL